MKFINFIALLLTIIGALNWGLWGFFQFDFVAWLVGGNTMWLARVIYAVIGIAGLWSLQYLGCCCRGGRGSCSCGCACCGKGKK